MISGLLRPRGWRSELDVEPAVDVIVDLDGSGPPMVELEGPLDESPAEWLDAGSTPRAERTTLALELIGSQLRAAGFAVIGRFSRLTDYVNFLNGFFQLSDVRLLTRIGASTRVSLPNLRVRLDEVTLVGQKDGGAASTSVDRRIGMQVRRLVVITAAHVISGETYLHEQASLTSFVDSVDPPFMPMTNVRVRYLADRRLVGRYPFALLQRSHIVGVATETPE